MTNELRERARAIGAAPPLIVEAQRSRSHAQLSRSGAQPAVSGCSGRRLHDSVPGCTTSGRSPPSTGTRLAAIAPLAVPAINVSYRFGPYHLDPSRRTLNRGREQVSLPDRQMDTRSPDCQGLRHRVLTRLGRVKQRVLQAPGVVVAQPWAAARVYWTTIGGRRAHRLSDPERLPAGRATGYTIDTARRSDRSGNRAGHLATDQGWHECPRLNAETVV
jgi:hypothetical protein